MTECSTELRLFPLPKLPVVVRDDGGEITSDAGVLLVRELDERLGLTARLAQCLPDHRDQSKVRHSLLALVRQRVYQIACGYEDCNDADWLRFDAALKLAVGKAPHDGALASQPTLCRMENGPGWRECYSISEAFVAAYIARHRAQPPVRIVLDVDTTDDECHGHQQLTFFHGYYDEHCYLPLLVFAQAEGVGEQELVAAVLRPGNVHAGHRALAVIKRVVARLREAFPHCALELRADSGLALPEVYDGGEAMGLPYTISLAKNERLKRLLEPWMEQARALHEETGEKATVFAEFHYAAETWPHERRVIAKAEVMREGENPRFVVTNRTDSEAEGLYRHYCQRGDPENRIKELKEGLRADRLSCHHFWANQFRLLLYGAAYVLCQAMRALLEGTELGTAQVSRLRQSLLKVGARVRQSVRRVLVQLPTSYRWFHLWPCLIRAVPA